MENEQDEKTEEQKERKRAKSQGKGSKERGHVQFQPLLTMKAMARRTQIHGISLTGINMKILEKEMSTWIPKTTMGMITNGI
eukprot:7359027-Prorocentrum_lima.AAC.1